MSDDVYEVFAVRYAHCARNRPDNFVGGDPHDVPMPLDYFVWVVRNAHRTFIVDTGFDEPMAKQRVRDIITPVADGLAMLGIEAAKVEDVILTHLHYDHAGNRDLFPHARYHLQDREMAYATGRCMCHHLLSHPFEPEDVVAMVRRVFAGRVAFHDGDAQVAPGITVHRVGGHSKGLQVVRVNTARGPVVLASDASHFYEHIEKNRAFVVLHNLEEMLEGYRIVRSLAPTPGHIVPGHDPLVMERYPAPDERLRGIVVRLDVDPAGN